VQLIDTYDVIVLGSGIAGLSAALAAQEAGLSALLIEKADKLGGTTTDSYGLIWVGNNHLMRDKGESDSREDVIAYMTFLGGGELDEERMVALVNRSPHVLQFFQGCGIRFRLVSGIVDHYFGVATGARDVGRTVEADLISGFELGDWRELIRTPKEAPYFVTAEEQTAWGGINQFSHWDRDIVRDRRAKDIRGKGVGLVSHFVKALVSRGTPILANQSVQSLTVNDGRVDGFSSRKGDRSQRAEASFLRRVDMSGTPI
jgi:3-oxosteroid 1-dehydrogenase